MATVFQILKMQIQKHLTQVKMKATKMVMNLKMKLVEDQVAVQETVQAMAQATTQTAAPAVLVVKAVELRVLRVRAVMVLLDRYHKTHSY